MPAFERVKDSRLLALGRTFGEAVVIGRVHRGDDRGDLSRIRSA
jgi:hypothetical protein